MTLLNEIRAVGIRDWLWFVVWLRRDAAYYDEGYELYRNSRQYERAHRIDEKLREAGK